MIRLNVVIGLSIIFISTLEILEASKIEKVSWTIIYKLHNENIQNTIQKRVTNGLPPLNWDDQVIKMAQSEAERLARVSDIDIPQLNTHLKYVAYIFKYEKLTGNL